MRVSGVRSQRDPRDSVVGPTGANAGRVLAIVVPIALSIALLALLGGLTSLDVLPGDAFDLGGEHNIPASFSALLLAASAGLVIAYSVVFHSGERHYAGLLMASMLAFMALDEVATIHEHLEARTGIDWQTLYLPVALVAGVAWVLVLRELLVERRVAAYWAVAAAAWCLSQLLEFFQYDAADNPVRIIGEMVFMEEVLEMVGSSLFGLSMLCAIDIVVRRRGNLDTSFGEHTFDR